MKYLKYLIYILKHKWYVFIECWKLGIPLKGVLHDLSKFLPSEFKAYTDKYFGNENEFKELEKIELNFLKAWNHHQKRNKHHPEYWIMHKEEEQKIFEMPLIYRKEMLADWKGASKAKGYGGDILTWYKRRRKKIPLAPKTRRWIEKQIGFENRPHQLRIPIGELVDCDLRENN
ncbi:MAG: DUF5662 family protein [archaeon]